MGSTGLTVLCPAVPPIARTAQLDRVLQCPSISFASPPLGQLPSAVCVACFPCSVTRPVFSFVLWRTTCNVLDLPGTPFLPSTRFHYPVSRPARPLRCPSCAGLLSFQIFGSTETREGCQGCGANPRLRNQMLRPCRAVRRCPVLWVERDADQQIPQRKYYIINRQNRLNAPGYIARAWAHYNTFRGAPFPRQMSQCEC